MDLLEARLDGGRIGFQLLAARFGCREGVRRDCEPALGLFGLAGKRLGIGRRFGEDIPFGFEPFDAHGQFGLLRVRVEQGAVGVLQALACLGDI